MERKVRISFGSIFKCVWEMLSSSSLWQELINDRRRFARSPSERKAIAQPCPTMWELSPVPSQPLSCSPASGSPPPEALWGREGAQAPGVLKCEPPQGENAVPLATSKAIEAGAPSLPPSPALTLRLTGLLRENWVLGGWRCVDFFNLLILLLHLRASSLLPQPSAPSMVSRPQPPGAEALRKCQ